MLGTAKFSPWCIARIQFEFVRHFPRQWQYHNSAVHTDLSWLNPFSLADGNHYTIRANIQNTKWEYEILIQNANTYKVDTMKPIKFSWWSPLYILNQFRKYKNTSRKKKYKSELLILCWSNSSRFIEAFHTIKVSVSIILLFCNVWIKSEQICPHQVHSTFNLYAAMLLINIHVDHVACNCHKCQ